MLQLDYKLLGICASCWGRFSAIGTIGPTFFLAITRFSFVFQIGSPTAEKELKLRQAMTMMGHYDAVYWVFWLTWEGIVTLLSSLFTVLFGMMFQFDFFLNNSFAVVFLLFFPFQLNIIGFAFMLLAFNNKSSSSTTVGFSIFIVGLLTQLVTAFGFPYRNTFSCEYRIIWSLFPPNLLAKVLQLLADVTATPQYIGISWKRETECAPNENECIIVMIDIYIWLISTFAIWFLLAIYFDNIIPNSSGVCKSIFYFLRPGYWTGRGGHKVEEGSICSCFGSIPLSDQIVPDDQDVLEKESIDKQQMKDGVEDPTVAVQIRGLAKTYPGTSSVGCCNAVEPHLTML